MLEDGLSYPVRGDWIGRIIIGGALSFFSFLILPIFLVNGYLLRVLEGTVEGYEEPPEFTDWGTLFAKGVGAFVIVFAYALIPLVLYMIIISMFVGGGAAIGGDAGGFMAGFGLLAMFLAIPLLLVVYYLIPAALSNYAAEGEIAAGFDFGVIRDVVLTSEYLIAVLLPIVVAIILWMATFVLAMTVIGIVFLPFLQFYGQVAVFRMFGVAFATVSEKGTV